MDINNLIKMANQIGQFFEGGGKPDMVAGDIAGHLKRFWHPRMRAQLLEYADEHDGEGLRPSVMDAIQSNADVMRGSHRPIIEEPQFIGPEGGGDAG